MKKRRQHYVWREYLRAWSTNESIWCRIEGRIIRTNLMNVAQSRDFYRLQDLDTNDVELICQIAVENTPAHMQELSKKWIWLFRTPFRWKRLVEQRGMGGEEFEKIFDEAINNFEEELHSKIEEQAIPYLQAVRNGDIGFSVTDDGYMAFIHFLCIQYMRTNQVKSRVMDALRLRRLTVNLEKVWNVLAHIFATNMAWGFYEERHLYRIHLLENKSRSELITGDQPVINTYALVTPESEPPEDAEFYYPISPKLAVLVTKSNAGPGAAILSEDDVRRYNSMMVDQSHSQVYAASKETLVS